jgi:hypothetical protein
MQMQLPVFAVLALLCSSALADCKEASGGQIRNLGSPVIWHARTDCGGSTLLWFQSFVGSEGKNSTWRVDDLLILTDLEKAQTLSLAASPGVECRQRSGQSPLVFAVGEWNPRAAQGERQRAYRAWRMDPATRKVEELPARDVACVIR